VAFHNYLKLPRKLSVSSCAHYQFASLCVYTCSIYVFYYLLGSYIFSHQFISAYCVLKLLIFYSLFITHFFHLKSLSLFLSFYVYFLIKNWFIFYILLFVFLKYNLLMTWCETNIEIYCFPKLIVISFFDVHLFVFYAIFSYLNGESFIQDLAIWKFPSPQ
jgi:hypothetical protein